MKNLFLIKTKPMKIKNFIYLALLPLSIAGAALSYKFISKKRNKGRREQNERVFSGDAPLIDEIDVFVFQALESVSRHYAVDGKVEGTAKKFLSMFPACDEIDVRDIGRSFSKLHKYYPYMIHKKKINGKEVRANAGFVWVYEPKNIDK